MKTDIQVYLKKVSIALGALISASLLCSCVPKEIEDKADTVITALPTEIEGCTFIADVDSSPAVRIENARFALKVKTIELGGTHLVETHAYPTRIVGRTLGVVLSGRAYKCPLGKGPKVTNELALTKTPDMNVEYLMFDDEEIYMRRSFFWF